MGEYKDAGRLYRGALCLLPQHFAQPGTGAEMHLCTNATGMIATVRTTAASTCCPLCGQTSSRIHSRYMRCRADLPSHKSAMKMVL